MSLFRKITESGVSFADSNSEKRNVRLTNYISLVSVAAAMTLLAGRIALAQINSPLVLILSSACVLFLLPILFNYFGFTRTSRILLCWLPSLAILCAAVWAMDVAGTHETSNYVGLRFFQLAFSCYPFLVFNVGQRRLFIPAMAGPLLSILVYDPLLSYFGHGYYQVGLSEPTYIFNNFRAIVSLLIIGSSCYLLKKNTEHSEENNARLLEELAEKNKLLEQRSTDELHQLNEQLYANLQHLSEREFFLNESQRMAKIGSWEYRVKDDYIFLSDEIYNIFGLDKKFVPSGQQLVNLFQEGESDIIVNASRNLLATGQPFELTLRARTPLGYKKWVRVGAFPILEEQTVVGIRAICHDITFYKGAEEQLRNSEQKFSRVFQNNPDLTTLTREEDLVIVDVNDKVESVMGYSREEVLGRSTKQFQFFVHAADRELFFEQYAATGKSDMECSWQRKDGKVIHVLVSSRQLELDGVKHFISAIRDISDRKIAEERFQKSFDLNPDLMLIFRERDRVLVEANSKLESLTYYKRENVIGRSSTDVPLWINPEDRKQHNEEYAVAGIAIREALLRKNGGEVFYASVTSSRIQFSGENHILVVVRDITDRKLAEAEKEAARHALNERIKELTTLYRAGQLLQDEKMSVDQILDEIAKSLPAGWQYPEITEARIEIGTKLYSTPNFSLGYAKQRQEFPLPDGQVGAVEITYLEKRRYESEGPFLKEERNLINMIAEMLRTYFAHRHEADELNRSEANLHATINNTEVLIWSVNRSFQLLTFNKPFAQYIEGLYGSKVRVGSRIFNAAPTEETNELTLNWTERYMRALSGEVITLEETRHGIDFHYSLSPVIEGDQIIGVSVFADNITERKLRDRELAEANKKVGELKLMALRSVMSPHFIFNVLNSIQFFIAKNDRLNAINHLSTFSKLIRSILTHSVNNKIKLSEEIEMLKNYVQLEMTRFENKFDFALTVSDGVDIDGIEIPSLLIQPYVENAILHGLYNKKEKGKLSISIQEEDDAVVFEIEDDGIGREAAMKLRQQNFPTHKSMGIKLTEERLKLINQQHHAAFQIEDLVNENGPRGTRVRIRVLL